jgi:chromosome segregation ATPase
MTATSTKGGTMPRDWERELAEMRERAERAEGERSSEQKIAAWCEARAHEAAKERDEVLADVAYLSGVVSRVTRLAMPNSVEVAEAQAERDAALSRCAELEARFVHWRDMCIKVEDECESLKSRIAELEQDKLANDTSWSALQGHWQDEKARADALEAQAAVMRGAVGALIDWQGVTHEDDDCPEDDTCRCPIVVKVNAAFRTDAGRALAERVACLEEVAEAARKIPPYLNPRLNGALYRLDALRGGAK